MVTAEFRTQPAGFLQIFLHVIAVCAEHNQLAAQQEVFQGVRTTLTVLKMASHPLHGGNVVRVHAFEGFLGEGPKKLSARARRQQQ